MTDEWHVNTPGKAYNVMTVGGFDDHNNGNWDDDVMWEKSCYVDPYIDGSTTSTYSKPDVVAVGADVTAPQHPTGMVAYGPVTGTSYASPQVAGIAALLIQRYYHLRTNPETIKAIIMTSAINDIEGDPLEVLGDKDGAGGVSAARAMAIFDRGGWMHHIIADIYDLTDPSNPFTGPASEYEFRGSDTEIWDVGSTRATVGDRVRAVLCWDSNPSAQYVEDVGTDRLSSIFDVRVIAPSDVQVAYSVSSYNNCEAVDFIATETGEYRLRVKYYDNGYEESNLSLGIAWLPLSPTDNMVYIPVVIRRILAR